MMSQPIAYAVVAMVCYGVCDFIYKQAATAGIRADHFLMVQAWFFCSLVILYALATGTIVLDPAALWGMLAGVLAFVGLYYFIRSLAAGAVSTNASIFRLNFIVTVALVVVLLGEPLTLRKITGSAVDRGRVVREALAIILGDLAEHGEDSQIAERLRTS